jgi:hypothetical protein
MGAALELDVLSRASNESTRRSLNLWDGWWDGFCGVPADRLIRSHREALASSVGCADSASWADRVRENHAGTAAARPLPPDSGRVTQDGMDLAGIDPRAVRSQIGVVTQDAQLFGMSIRENIAITDPSLPLSEVVEAAKVACIHVESDAMHMGYDTVHVELGASLLSGGQRQRLALARALVPPPAHPVAGRSHQRRRHPHRVRCLRQPGRFTGNSSDHRPPPHDVEKRDLIVVLDAGRLGRVRHPCPTRRPRRSLRTDGRRCAGTT